MSELRRELENMPFDKSFTVDGNEQLCHATGFEVCWDNPDNPADWWEEFVDYNGEFHYGR